MIASVPLNVSILPPPDPYSVSYGNLILVFSRYGRPIPLPIFIAAYVRCLWQIWSVVAHSPNYYQPPDELPLDGPVFEFQNVFFHLRLQRASSAVVNWKYVQLYETLNALIDFAATYNMREMDVEVVAAGVGAFGGVIRYSGPPGASQ